MPPLEWRGVCPYTLKDNQRTVPMAMRGMQRVLNDAFVRVVDNHDRESRNE